MRRVLFTIFVICIGCGSIPSVVFVADDAAAGNDGGSEGGDDGALPDGSGADTGPLMCGSSPLPEGATCCAGSVACVGDCKPAGPCRQDCETQGCAAQGKVCCRANGGVKCVMLGVDPCP